MIAVPQTRTGRNGNCLAACLASLLETEIGFIPEFTDEHWMEELAEFLGAMDLIYVRVPVEDPMVQAMLGTGTTYHVIEGISPRGGRHAVVGRNGFTAFDPHPHDGTGRGLKDAQYYGFLFERMK